MSECVRSVSEQQREWRGVASISCALRTVTKRNVASILQIQLSVPTARVANEATRKRSRTHDRKMCTSTLVFPTSRCVGQGCEAVEQSDFPRVNSTIAETLCARLFSISTTYPQPCLQLTFMFISGTGSCLRWIIAAFC